MRVAVTGGNGFIGFGLVQRLLQAGHRVKCLVHRTRHLIEDLDVEIVPGSITDPDSLAPLLRDTDVVFHLAGSGKAGDWGAKDWFFEMNAEGTRHVLDSAVRWGVRRFVHLSSLAVHRFVGYVDADETTPADQNKYAYGASKLEAERLVTQAFQDGRIDTVIVRPGLVVYGPYDTTAFIYMAPLLRKGRWFHLAGGKKMLCLSYVDNLADGLLLAAEHRQAPGQTFVITDDLRLSWKEYIHKLIEAFGVADRCVSLPMFLGRFAGISLEALFRLAGSKSPPPITDYRTALVAKDFHFSCQKAKRVLGYLPRIPLDEGVRKTVDWYRHTYPG